jgi:hypothetical protein
MSDTLPVGVNMLESEQAYFQSHCSELQAQFPGQFVVIKGEQVAGAFPSIQEALQAGSFLYGMESFLIRNVSEKPQRICIPAMTLGILRADPEPSTER